MSDESKPDYKLPTPVLEEQHYSYAIVVELQRIRAAIEKLAGSGAQLPEGDVALKEPKAKPKRGET